MSTSTLPVVSGPWGLGRVESFLSTTVIPVRLATQTAHGPWVQSMWFDYAAGVIRCATPRGALLAQRLERTPECAFEVAPDTQPYMGVRGRAVARLETKGAADLLDRLLNRYLGDRSPDLQQNLRAKADQELAIELRVTEWVSWDFSQRMS